jgi:hypothetical protein
LEAEVFCEVLDGSSEAYESCTGVVDPAPYYSACVHAFCTGTDADACAAISSYEKVCEQRAVFNIPRGLDNVPMVIDRCGVCHGDGNSCRLGLFTCRTYGANYHVFSGEHFTFDGRCDYVLAEPCSRRAFRVHAHKDEDSGQMTEVNVWVEHVGVVHLGADLTIRVDSVATNTSMMPMRLADGSLLEYDAGEVVLTLRRTGTTVTWNAKAKIVSVSYPPSSLVDMCGLCAAGLDADRAYGANEYSADKCASPVNSDECKYEQMGSSHLVLPEHQLRDISDEDTCKPIKPRPDNPCDADAIKKSSAERYCETLLLAKGAYQHCHARVDPDVFYAACVKDMCIADDSASACSVYHSYERACRDAGVRRMGSVVDRCGNCFGDGTSCSSDYGILSVWSDPHVMTLDQLFFDFDGGCEYILLRDTASRLPKFEIHVLNRNVSGLMMAHAAGLRIRGVVESVVLHLEGRVILDGSSLVDSDFPHMLSDGTTLMKHPDSSISIVLGRSRITILWSGDGAITVEVPGQYRSKVNGIGGNFDGDRTNDAGIWSTGSLR